MSELMPCPFCGSNKLHCYDEPSQADDKRLNQVYCTNCHTLGPRKYTVEDCKRAWNNQSQLTEAREALGRYARHEFDCDTFLPTATIHTKCTCGLDKALAKLTQGEGK